jgi:hypothetical protein
MSQTATLLAQVEAAISALLTGGASSYSIGNRSVSKLDLAALMDQRNKLTRQLERESGNGITLGKMSRVSR